MVDVFSGAAFVGQGLEHSVHRCRKVSAELKRVHVEDVPIGEQRALISRRQEHVRKGGAVGCNFEAGRCSYWSLMSAFKIL